MSQKNSISPRVYPQQFTAYQRASLILTEIKYLLDAENDRWAQSPDKVTAAGYRNNELKNIRETCREIMVLCDRENQRGGQ